MTPTGAHKPRAKTPFLCLALALALMLSVSACNKAEKSDNIAAPNTITVGSSADAKRLLPLLASDSASADISGLLFNGLTKLDKDLNVVGDLAEGWDVSPDGLVITFRLRKGVKWHDGAEFTADDVIFSYKTAIDPNVPTPYSSYFDLVKSVEAVDPYTVRVTYDKPFAPALEYWAMGIIPKHALEGKDITEEKFSRFPIGTGPYRLEEWLTGQKIVLEAFDGYFEGRPNIDRYIMRIIPDDNTQFLELKSGGLDLMALTPPQYKYQTDNDFFRKHFQKFRYPAFVYTYLGYNLLDPKFKDKRVRRAIAHAIDKQSIIEGVLMGYGTPATGPFLPDTWAYNPVVDDPEYDPEKAKALLAEAGWTPGKDGTLVKDGQPFKFAVMTNHDNKQRLQTAQIIKEQLKAVGIEVEIQALEWQAMLHEFIDKKRFEAIIMGWGGLAGDPDIYLIWHSSQTKEGAFNFISYKNDEVDRLLIEGRQTFDMNRRKEIYNRVHAILAEEQPYTFLYVPDALPVLHARFKGVEKAPMGIMYDFIKWRVPEDKTQWYTGE